MRILVVVALLLCGSQADKERVDNNYADLLSDELIQKIEKRLQQWDLDDTDNKNPVAKATGDVITNAGKLSCHFTMQDNTIIRTKDSLDAGATYQSAPSVSSREECRKECCKLGTKCNLAVYKDKKEEDACYLFDCGTPNVCNFSSHAGYVSMHISRWMDDQQKIVDQHEDALEQLATDPDNPTTAAMVPSQNGGSQSQAVLPVPYNIQVTETTSTSIKLKWESSEDIFSVHWHYPGESENTVVTSVKETVIKGLEPNKNYTVYVIGYNAQGATVPSSKITVSTSDDVPLKYPPASLMPVGTSLNVTWKSLSPSDARGLVTQYKVVYRKHGSQTKKMVKVPGSSNEYVINDVEPGESYDVRIEAGTRAGFAELEDDGWLTATVLHESQEIRCSKFQFACTSGKIRCIAIYDACDTVDHCSDGSDEKNCGNDGAASDNLLLKIKQYIDILRHRAETGKQSGSQGKQDGTKPKETNSKSDDSSSGVTAPSSSEKPAGVATSTKSPAETEKPTDAPAAVPEKKAETGADVEIPGHLLKVDEEAKKSKLQNIRFNQTAVLVLALGLSITALLLIFAGCRLRTVKKRLRKGRPLNSNEADYLINGMYL